MTTMCLNNFFKIVICLLYYIRYCISVTNNPVCFWDGDNIIDLRSVLNDNNNKTFITVDTYFSNSTRFYYNPCYSLGYVNEVCNYSVICKEDMINSDFVNIGDFSTILIETGQEDELSRINYEVTQKKELFAKGSTLILTCIDSDKPIFDYMTFTTFNDGDEYFFMLRSQRFCRNKVSVGTVLCVTFISVMLVYLVVGMLYRKAAFGVSGKELIPNLSFWTSLPGLIKDGYLFFISPCIGKRSEYDDYERI